MIASGSDSQSKRRVANQKFQDDKTYQLIELCNKVEIG